MFGEILIIIVGFFRWILNGFKSSLKDEIYGNKDRELNRSDNYLWGLVAVMIILILLILFS